MLVASFADPVAADYANCVSGVRACAVDLSRHSAVQELQRAIQLGTASNLSACVLFLPARLTGEIREALDALGPLLKGTRFLAVVSSFAVHLGDQEAAMVESLVLDRLKRWPARLVIFRAGQIVSAHSRTGKWLHRWGFAYPLVPRRLRNCFVEIGELFAAIETERAAAHSRQLVTLLGPNRPWRDLLQERRQRGTASACLSIVCLILAVLLVGQIAALVFNLVLWRRPSLRRWSFDTLRPSSFRELLALCNRHNIAHVKVVGYNNGVIHFGQRFPGRTVVSTVLCRRIVRTGTDIIKADGGATVRDATSLLRGSGQELYVLPNYSYVCLGTAFFVPIHGSAATYTTVADTIVKVLLYDPVNERFLMGTRDQPAFRDYVYNLETPMLLLRVCMRVKPASQYFVCRQEWENPSGPDLLGALLNPKASNVEIRKAQAASAKVRVATYFNTAVNHSHLTSGVDTSVVSSASRAGSTAVEIPRDSLGRLWDRLEENRLTSFLMHALTRYFAWHVELFLTAEEFAVFWRTHVSLPLKKLQFRYIRRDGLPHSPFRDHDCIAVDLFMLRWHRKSFDAYLRQTFVKVRTNPGKHSG
jgi:hypothetical protein